MAAAGGGGFFSTLIKWMFNIWICMSIMNMLTRFLSGPSTTQAPKSDAPVAPAPPRELLPPLWRPGQPYRVHFYWSNSANDTTDVSVEQAKDEGRHLWTTPNLRLSWQHAPEHDLEKNVTINISKTSLLSFGPTGLPNGTLFLHARVQPTDHAPNAKPFTLSTEAVAWLHRRPSRRVRRHLFGAESGAAGDADGSLDEEGQAQQGSPHRLVSSATIARVLTRAAEIFDDCSGSSDSAAGFTAGICSYIGGSLRNQSAALAEQSSTDANDPMLDGVVHEDALYPAWVPAWPLIIVPDANQDLPPPPSFPLKVDPSTNRYYPLSALSDFWAHTRSFIPINESLVTDKWLASQAAAAHRRAVFESALRPWVEDHTVAAASAAGTVRGMFVSTFEPLAAAMGANLTEAVAQAEFAVAEAIATFLNVTHAGAAYAALREMFAEMAATASEGGNTSTATATAIPASDLNPETHTADGLRYRDTYLYPYPYDTYAGELPLTLSVRYVGVYTYMMHKSEEIMQQHWGGLGMGMGDPFAKTKWTRDRDMIRESLADKPLLLAVSSIVSVLHLVLSVLAFRADVSFWRQPIKAGIAPRVIAFDAICSVIIFFYLLDRDAAAVVLWTSGIGAAIDVWKVKKVFRLRRVGWRLERMPFEGDDGDASVDAVTDEVDAKAMRWMAIGLAPLCVAYSAWSLVVEQHRGWSSWVLESAVGCIYTFGFVRMVPQLLINYRLKSVAHMPWGQMWFKAVDTFIDDLFAFLVDMPFLRRVACFRDDVIFIGFLIQRYLYVTDKRRVNEFGYCEATDAPVGSAAGAVTSDAAPQALPAPAVPSTGAPELAAPPAGQAPAKGWAAAPAAADSAAAAAAVAVEASSTVASGDVADDDAAADDDGHAAEPAGSAEVPAAALPGAGARVPGRGPARARRAGF